MRAAAPISSSSTNTPPRTLVSIQLLSVSICFFCTAYLILSIFYPIPLQKIVAGLNFQPKQTNSSSIINISKLLAVTEQPEQTQQPIKISIPTNESFICDYVKPVHKHNHTSSASFEKHRVNALLPYCDIVPTPRNKWISARRYTESDIVFLIYTGAGFYHNRATAIRDTWLSRVTHKYFFSSTPYPTLPVTVIEGAGEDYLSNMKKLYVGMRLAYQQHNQTAKFYYLAGCDTFVNVPHIIKRLDSFDYNQPLIVGGYAFGHNCYIRKNETSYGITYPSGGAGFFLSAKMMEMMYPKLIPFFENDWPMDSKPYTDVGLNCLAYSLGVKPSFVPGFWAFNPQQTLKDSGRKALHEDPEPNTFHYVHPTSMYVLDEFYVFQHIDRLSNDGNLIELVKFTRQFVAAHYELLRIKTLECTLPKVKQRKR